MKEQLDSKIQAVVHTSKIPRELLERAYREIQVKKENNNKGEPA